MADPNMELIRQLREAMEEEGFTPTTDNGWIGTVSDVARLARDHARLTAENKALRSALNIARSYVEEEKNCAEDVASIGCATVDLREIDDALSAEAGDTDG